LQEIYRTEGALGVGNGVPGALSKEHRRGDYTRARLPPYRRFPDADRICVSDT
jgi:hypothetical protein